MSLRSFSLNGEYDLIPAEGHQPYLDPMREDEVVGDNLICWIFVGDLLVII